MVEKIMNFALLTHIQLFVCLYATDSTVLPVGITKLLVSFACPSNCHYNKCLHTDRCFQAGRYTFNQSVINQCNNPLHHPLTGRRQTSVAHAGPVCVCFFKHKCLSVSCRVLLVICTKRNLGENRGLSVYVCLYVKGRQTRKTFYKRKGDGQLLWPQVCCPNLSALWCL